MKIGYSKLLYKHLLSFQLEKLQPLCDDIFIESSKNVEYKEELLQKLSAGDTIVATRFIVIAGNLQELMQLLKRFNNMSIDLVIIEQEFATTKQYELEYLLELLSGFIKDIQYQRQMQGITKAKAKGVKFGRPKKMTIRGVEKAIRLKHRYTSKQVANKLGVGKSTLLRYIADYKKAG